jgi:2,3-diketo-5-methylthio-1-phosphopentane phosphatase
MSKNLEKLRVYIDFDGTITEKEICLELFSKFCPGYDEVIKRFFNEELNLRQLWKILVESLPGDVSFDDMIAVIDRFEPEPYFKPFIDYCKERDIPVMIVSDGFDIYIRRILENAGLSEIPSRSNKIVFEDGKYKAVFPGATESCTCNAASCKRNVLLNHSEDDSIIAYVGDGLSDFCAVRHSDLIFAKKRLAVYCSQNKLPHYPVKSFFDVRQRLDAVISGNKLKQRNQAFVNRKNAFETE